MRPFIFNDIIDDDDDLPFGPSDNTHSDSNAKVDEITFDTIKVSSDPELFKVVPLSEKAKRFCEVHVGKLNRITDNVSDIIRMDAALFESGNNFVSGYKNTDCEFRFKSTSVIINDGDVKTLNVGICYRQPFYYEDGTDCILPVEILFAADDATFGMFDVYESVSEKHDALIKYNFLTTAQKEFFKKQYNSPAKTVKKDDSVYTPIRDAGALKVLYETCKHSYDENVRLKAEVILSQLSGSSGYGDKADLKNQLSHILGINTHHKPFKKMGFHEIIDVFNSRIYGLTDFKEKLAEFILAMQHSKDISFAALLIGSPGVGKTSAAEVMAECMGKELLQIDCSGADVIAMSGLVRSYGGAKAGKVIDGLWEAGYTDLLLFFDEIDKLSITKDGNPYSIFLKALGPQRMLHDEYVETDIDISSSIILASANNIEDVPGYVLNRFGDNIFFIDDYSSEEKVEIAKQFTVKKVLAEHSIDPEALIMSDEALNKLAEEYCEDAGMREMTGYLRTIARKAIRLWHCNEIETPLIVDEDFIKKYIKKKPSFNRYASRKAGF